MTYGAPNSATGIGNVWFVYFDESGFVISKIWGNQEVHDGSLHPSLHRRTSPKLAKKSLWLELTGLFCTSHCTSIVNYMSTSQRFTICTYSNFIPSHVLIHPICNFIFLTMHHYIILSKWLSPTIFLMLSFNFGKSLKNRFLQLTG